MTIISYGSVALYEADTAHPKKIAKDRRETTTMATTAGSRHSNHMIAKDKKNPKILQAH
jgi:hypothetical protein